MFIGRIRSDSLGFSRIESDWGGVSECAIVARSDARAAGRKMGSFGKNREFDSRAGRWSGEGDAAANRACSREQAPT